MKLLLSILIITLLGTCYTQQRPGFTQMAARDYTNNALIKTLQDVGSKFVLQRAFDLGRIADVNFTVGTINYILNRTTTSVTLFDFNISLVNAQNDTLEAAFVVFYFPANQTNKVDAFTFSIVYGAASIAAGLDSAYEPVPEDEHDTPLIQTLAEHGKEHLVDIMVARGRIPAGTYDITEIQSVEKLDLVDGSNYQFEMNFAQAGGLNEVHGQVRERYFTATENITVVAFHFDVVGEEPANAATTTTTPTTTTP
jgi:hypothetical protein